MITDRFDFCRYQDNYYVKADDKPRHKCGEVYYVVVMVLKGAEIVLEGFPSVRKLMGVFLE